MKISSSSGVKRWKQGKRSRPGRWPNCTNRLTDYERKMSVYEPSWTSVEPSNRGNLLALFPPSRPGKGKEVVAPDNVDLPVDDELSFGNSPLPCRSPSPNTVEAHSRKSHLADPTGPLVSQGVGCGGNPIGTNDRQHQLTDMCLTRPGASPHQRHPCTRLSRPRPGRRCLFPPPFGDHRTCSPLPFDSISWTTILPAAFPYHPSPCTTVLPIRTITCYITTRQ